MTRAEVYNPLSKLNLAKSIEGELLARSVDPLSSVDVIGSGVYAIYYTGDFSIYQILAQANSDGKYERPIYVGKAIPKGGRKGGGLFKSAGAAGRSLADRLKQHANSIDECSNLRARLKSS